MRSAGLPAGCFTWKDKEEFRLVGLVFGRCFARIVLVCNQWKKWRILFMILFNILKMSLYIEVIHELLARAKSGYFLIHVASYVLSRFMRISDCIGK